MECKSDVSVKNLLFRNYSTIFCVLVFLLVLVVVVIADDAACDANAKTNHVTQLTVCLDRMCLPSSRPRDNFLFKIAQFIFFSVHCWQAIAMIVVSDGWKYFLFDFDYFDNNLY